MTSAAETWDAIYRGDLPMRWWPSEDVVRFVRRRLRIEQSGLHPRVLEVGCGNGGNTWGLVDFGCSVVAIDASNEAIHIARRYVGDRRPSAAAEFHVACLDQLRNFAETDHYAAIVDCRVSQHVPWSQHLGLYREYGALLKSGGWLFLFHLDANTSDAHRNDDLRTEGERFTWDDIESGSYPGNGLVCMPPPEDLGGALSAAGFAVERAEIVQRLTSGVVVSHTALDARKPG